MIKNIKWIILIIITIVITTIVAVFKTHEFDLQQIDDDYQKLNLPISNDDIKYFTFYENNPLFIYKVYKLDSSLKDKLLNHFKSYTLWWTKNKYYAYIMNLFYDIIGDNKKEIDKDDLYFYHEDYLYGIIDLKNDKLYYLCFKQNLSINKDSLLNITTDNYVDYEIYNINNYYLNSNKDYYVYQFKDKKGKNILKSLEDNDKWSKTPLTSDKLIYFEDKINNIENAYYYFDILPKGEEIGIYDIDNNTLYYIYNSI